MCTTCGKAGKEPTKARPSVFFFASPHTKTSAPTLAHNFTRAIIHDMAKTSFQLIPPEYLLDYKKALQSGDRYQFPRVRVKNAFFSRNKLKGLTQRSIIPLASPLWDSLSSSARLAWDTAATYSNTTGWKLFLRDYSFRLKNSLPGIATPSNFYQVEVGKLSVESPATRLKIAQFHPQTYWVSRKVRGTRDMRQPVLVVEDFDLPLSLTVSYTSSLTSLGAGSKARIYCILYSHYQGRTIENLLEINIPMSQAWTTTTVTQTKVVGVMRGYTLFAEIENARGTLHFDNVKVEHSGQNWARDTFCNDIDQSFTKMFAQVPKNWVALELSEGAFFGSVYYN
jgi:hypothetical protein